MMGDTPETKPVPEPAAETAPSAAGLLVGLFLFATLIGLEYVVMHHGYEAGIRTPGDTPGNLLAILLPFFGIIQIALIIWIAAKWSKNQVSHLVTILFLVSALQLGVSHYVSWIHGINSGHYWLSRYQNTMRRIGTDLDSYYKANNAHPPNLSALPSASPMPALPYGPIQYAAGNGKYVLWANGPDGKADIQDGPELKAAIGDDSPWLVNRTYDPTNGLSAGDIVWLGPRYEANVRYDVSPGRGDR